MLRALPLLFMALPACRGGDGRQASSRESAAAIAAQAPCVLVAADTLAVLACPSPASDDLGTLATGDTVRPAGAAAGGWLGFRPGRAETDGPSRLRWVAPDGPFTLSGSCLALPALDEPREGCFASSPTPRPVAGGRTENED